MLELFVIVWERKCYEMSELLFIGCVYFWILNEFVVMD